MLEHWETHFALYPSGGVADRDYWAFALMNIVQALTGGKWVGASQERDHDREPFNMSDFQLHRLPQTVAAAETQPERWPFDPEDPEAAMRRAETLIRARMQGKG